jgi:hypothetical protein
MTRCPTHHSTKPARKAEQAGEFKRFIVMGTKGHCRFAAAIIFASFAALPAVADGFRADSKLLGNSKMDIVITETAREARTSVLDIQVRAVGSSVGSSFFIACSLRDLARQRGGFRHVVKVEEQPRRGQMLVGFLAGADEAPEQLDARFAGQKAIDLEQFAPICAMMK